MSQITTITLFRYSGLRNKLWAFGMMQFAHKHLKGSSGLEFYKLLGSGKKGFNPLPDWSVYALFQIWNDEKQAEDFFASSKLIRKYQNRTEESWILFLKSSISRGEWSGSNPFQKSPSLDQNNPYIVAITRANIKTKLLFKFWKYVPKSQHGLLENDGLIYTKGFGEVPIKHMATFSVWKDKKSLDSFAYQNNPHVGAIRQTRILDWYKEELFSRFQPYRSIGTWEGKNPLPSLDPN
ncbi:DUF3291 domain-containing protein [Flagellimonas allohymeniacidonis]|uniref:DUF3291 domain-containing protein n=1 Tax=Flagellimonas allohymeniacidonis TaxID=2517819 RepID=A0A4Q8Q8U5_9FLAO|nr:DUF3291 domain-containing protein [Allomuricauda hymeniacidonis]TAI46652.1 DUF3291 domain-containing protein [Allomuricauda hymeniacidonis]